MKRVNIGYGGKYTKDYLDGMIRRERMDKMNVVEQLRGKLIVSCQAEAGYPLNTPEHLAALAQTVVMGGAGGIRASGPENLQAMRVALGGQVPLIGIFKRDYPGFEVRITPTLVEAEAVAAAGADMIALDATHHPRPGGLSLAELVEAIRVRTGLPVMADISTFDEGVAAASMGVDCVATTLAGYTGAGSAPAGPDIELVRKLAQALSVAVMAEGRITTPQDVRLAFEAGAHAVVVGSMITRPHLITQYFLGGLPVHLPARVLALDIGGTKIAGGIVDARGSLLVERMAPTPAGQGGLAIVEAASSLLAGLLRDYTSEAPQALGISTGGQVDAQGQITGSTGMFRDWVGSPLKETLAQRFSLRVAVLNDGQAAALAEVRLGAGRGFSSLLGVVIGTGLGGGLVVDGHIQHGAHGLAGSLGQLKVTADGEQYFPLEYFVSGSGLAREYNRLAGGEHPAASGLEVAERAQAGEVAARQAVEAMGYWLGLGLSHALHSYDAACVVVAGSVARLGESLLEPARRSLLKHGHSTVAHTPVLAARFGAQAGLVGAGLYALEQLDRS